jgi:hypothetical protein
MQKRRGKKVKPPEPSKPTETTPKDNPPLPPWLRYLRTLGIFSSCVGGGVLMGEYFWWGVGFVYLAFVLLVLDFCFEPDLKRYPKMKLFLISLIGVAFLYFTFKLVIVSAPLEVQAIDFGSGMTDESGKNGDILWKSYYHDVHLSINNQTDDDYTNLTTIVSTDLYIAHVGRFGKCLDGSVASVITQNRPMMIT